MAKLEMNGEESWRLSTLKPEMDTNGKTTEPVRFLIVGGVAAGASAAARARRLDESAHITLIERGPDPSFANCGMPYHIGGEIEDRGRLAVQTPQSLRDMLAIEVLPRTEAIRIDRAAKTVTVRAVGSGEERAIPYDKLLLAPGASPRRPPLPGMGDPRLHTLRNLEDMDRIRQAVVGVKRVAVVGAGFIGLEMAEQLVRLGREVDLIELRPQVLPQLDPEMTGPVAQALRQQGVRLTLGNGIRAFHPSPDTLSIELADGQRVETETVILALGVRPESHLAEAAGLRLGERGHIVVDPWMRTSDPDIYAAGDVVETVDAVLGQPSAFPLGGPANRQGRLVADHIFRPDLARPYPGSLGTAIVRVFDAVTGLTGWTEARLRQQGIPCQSALVTDFHHAGYFPGARQLTLKITWNPEDGRLLGAQATGPEGVDKRLDVLAAALRGGLTVADLAELDLAYAPPFGAAKDIINLAGQAACNLRHGLMRAVAELPAEGSSQVVDVRPGTMAALDPIPGSIAIPLQDLRASAGERLDPGRPVVTVCALGKMSYFAARILSQMGYEAHSLSGGLRARRDFPEAARPQSPTSTGPTSPTPSISPTPTSTAQPTPMSQTPEPTTVKLDATGLSCPGPILKVRAASDKLAPGTTLEVSASDSGFARDLAAFCQAMGLEFLGTESRSGTVIGRLRKPLHTQAPATLADPQPESRAGSHGATLVVFSQEMDKVMAALVIANGALALGGPATLFFTFWGLNALRRGGPVTVSGKTFMDKMFGFMMPRGLDRLSLSHMSFGGLGTRLMKWRMGSKNLPNLHTLLADAQAAGVRLVACSMSMEAMGIRAEELIPGVEIGGVAEFLGAASKTRANLFI